MRAAAGAGCNLDFNRPLEAGRGCVNAPFDVGANLFGPLAREYKLSTFKQTHLLPWKGPGSLEGAEFWLNRRGPVYTDPRGSRSSP
jgi:hypothetical protein